MDRRPELRCAQNPQTPALSRGQSWGERGRPKDEGPALTRREGQTSSFLSSLLRCVKAELERMVISSAYSSRAKLGAQPSLRRAEGKGEPASSLASALVLPSVLNVWKRSKGQISRDTATTRRDGVRSKARIAVLKLWDLVERAPTDLGRSASSELGRPCACPPASSLVVFLHLECSITGSAGSKGSPLALNLGTTARPWPRRLLDQASLALSLRFPLTSPFARSVSYSTRCSLTATSSSNRGSNSSRLNYSTSR